MCKQSIYTHDRLSCWWCDNLVHAIERTREQKALTVVQERKRDRKVLRTSLQCIGSQCMLLIMQFSWPGDRIRCGMANTWCYLLTHQPEVWTSLLSDNARSKYFLYELEVPLWERALVSKRLEELMLSSSNWLSGESDNGGRRMYIVIQHTLFSQFNLEPPKKYDHNHERFRPLLVMYVLCIILPFFIWWIGDVAVLIFLEPFAIIALIVSCCFSFDARTQITRKFCSNPTGTVKIWRVLTALSWGTCSLVLCYTFLDALTWRRTLISFYVTIVISTALWLTNRIIENGGGLNGIGDDCIWAVCECGLLVGQLTLLGRKLDEHTDQPWMMVFCPTWIALLLLIFYSVKAAIKFVQERNCWGLFFVLEAGSAFCQLLLLPLKLDYFPDFEMGVVFLPSYFGVSVLLVEACLLRRKTRARPKRASQEPEAQPFV